MYFLTPHSHIYQNNDIKSLNTARKYMKQLADSGIMVPVKVGKEIIYLNIDLFNLLSET